jgi:hypothetical protein
LNCCTSLSDGKEKKIVSCISIFASWDSFQRTQIEVELRAIHHYYYIDVADAAHRAEEAMSGQAEANSIVDPYF